MKFLESSFLGKNEFWRYIVVLVIMYIIIQVVGAIPMLAYMFSESKGDPGAMAEIATSYNFGEYTLEIMVFPFIVGLLALVYLIPGFHKRPFKTVINGGKKFRWKNFFYGWIVWIGVSAIYLFVMLKMYPNDFAVNNLTKTLVHVILASLILIPFQAGFEEVLMRGYVMQGVTTLAKNTWGPLMVTAVIFALLHSFNPEVGAYGFFTAMAQYLLFGLIFGVIAIMDDGIEASIGAHAANNSFLCIMVTSDDSALQTSAIFKQLNVNPWSDFICMLIMSAIALFVLSRLLKWGKYTLLTSKVEPEKSEDEPVIYTA